MAKAMTKTPAPASQLKKLHTINREENILPIKRSTRTCVLKLKRVRFQENSSSLLTTQALLPPLSKRTKSSVPSKRCCNENQLQERKSGLFNEINNCCKHDEMVIASVNQKIPNSTKIKKCFVRLKRYPLKKALEAKENRITSTPNVPNSRKNSKKTTTKKEIHRSNAENYVHAKATEVFTCPISKISKGKNLRSAEKQNINIAVLKTSTPLRVASSFQREPFKELNLQFAENSVEHTAKQPINTKQKCGKFKNLTLAKSRNRGAIKSKNNNDISRFEPSKNSTHLETAVKETTKSAKELEISSKELPVDKSKKICSPNLVNQEDLIEQLLLSDDLDDVNSGATTVQPKLQLQPAAVNKIHKFFHRNFDNSIKNNEINPIPKSVNPVKKISNISKKPSYTKRRKVSVGNVYDFLSQSQTTDSDSAGKCDPAADIIKRLIQEGKVRVATHKKGTGKLTIKRRKVPKKRAAMRQKKIKPTIKKGEKKKETEVGEGKKQIDDYRNNNVVQPDEIHQPVETINLLEGSFSPPEKSTNNHSNLKSPHDSSAGAGTFSNLARSVLISQAGQQKARQRVTDQRILLEAALKFVSTPVNKKLPALDKTTNMSPILLQKEREQPPPPTCASPWRVDEEAHLPSVFYFNRNSENLPSFSSDFIPSTPRKQSPEAIPSQYICPDTHSTPDATFQNIDAESLAQRPTVLAKNLLSSLSSFSSNDSNAENMPPTPPPHVETHDAITTNVEAINKRQQLNPLRALNNRNPLKAINILEVIALPPWNSGNLKSSLNGKKDKTDKNHASVSNQSHAKTTGEASDIFGFDEYIDNEEEPQQVEIEETEESEKSDFRRKLQQLKHLRPKDDEIKTVSNTKPIRAVFDDGGGGGKQLNIKEMLCSTAINPASDTPNRCDAEESGTQELFEETEFNVKETRRTYERPFKRTRKLRHNFVMFMDSDESGEEESTSTKKDKVGHQKKRHKKDDKQNVEFDSFVKEFNEQCKQVDEYELIVE